MHKLMVLYRQPADAAHFRAHYESVHIPLVATMPGLIRYNWSFDNTDRAGNPSPFFCIFEAYFSDLSAMGQAMASPEGQAVAADVANCRPGETEMVHYAVPDVG
jgi:uncharacterized protein (TIGR02118 family)